MTINANREKTVISLGGSLVIPNSINVEFLQEFKELISRHVERGREFLIVVGGGATARNYQRALRELDGVDIDSLDWIGIEATRLNGALVARAFGDLTTPTVIEGEEDVTEGSTPVAVAAGWKPGQSTDAVALQAAVQIEAKEVIILSDIDRIYSADPKNDPDAKPLDEVSWKKLEELLPDSWNPGEHVPLDVEALRTGLKNDMHVIFMAGANLSTLAAYLERGEIEGTRIHP
ncbi:MAG: UMP kinase [Candidatus Paceibacterota bacterium]